MENRDAVGLQEYIRYRSRVKQLNNIVLGLSLGNRKDSPITPITTRPFLQIA